MESNKTYTEEELKQFAQFVLRDDSEKLSEFWLNHNLEKWKASREPKKEKPLFVTEDGVEIFHGGKWWSVKTEITDDFPSHRNVWKPMLMDYGLGHIINPDFVGKRFSTREKAQEYIGLHKPVLSYKDINSISNIITNYRLEISISELKKLIQQKLNHGGAGDCA